MNQLAFAAALVCFMLLLLLLTVEAQFFNGEPLIIYPKDEASLRLLQQLADRFGSRSSFGFWQTGKSQQPQDSNKPNIFESQHDAGLPDSLSVQKALTFSTRPPKLVTFEPLSSSSSSDFAQQPPSVLPPTTNPQTPAHIPNTSPAISSQQQYVYNNNNNRYNNVARPVYPLSPTASAQNYGINRLVQQSSYARLQLPPSYNIRATNQQQLYNNGYRIGQIQGGAGYGTERASSYDVNSNCGTDNTARYGNAATTQQNCCNIDPCFSSQANCALAKALPFVRRTPMSCKECAALCLSMLNVSPPYRCRAVVYDKNYLSCDIFAIDSRTYPLVYYANRVCFQPGPSCTAGPTEPQTTSGPLPSNVQCSSGEDAKFVFVQDHEIASAGQQTFPRVTLQSCLKACRQNQSPVDSSSVACLSFNYNQQTQECQFSSVAAAPKGTGKLNPKSKSGYYEKICIPSNFGQNCGDVFERVPQSILVGFAQSVVKANSFDECLENCIMSQQLYNFQCLSGMYYYEESGGQTSCILNVQTKDTMPELFVAEQQDIVDYFQINCGNRTRAAVERRSQQRHKMSKLHRFAKPKVEFDVAKLHDEMLNKLMSNNEWTSWSSCDLELVEKTRFRKCPAADIRLCEKEIEPCKEYSMMVPRSVELESEPRLGDDADLDSSLSPKLTTSASASSSFEGAVSSSALMTMPVIEMRPVAQASLGFSFINSDATTTSSSSMTSSESAFTAAANNERVQRGDDNWFNRFMNMFGIEPSKPVAVVANSDLPKAILR